MGGGERVFCGNLPGDVKEREIEDIFYKYGRINDISIKNPSGGSSFAFIDFDDSRDATDAVRGRDGYEFDRNRLRVEIAGQSRGGKGGDRGGGKGGGLGGKFQHRVIVTGLPKAASWQDLKDFLRPGGDVVFTDVRNGEGIGEYSKEEDMHNAVRKLDDTEFRSRFDEKTYVRVRIENDRGGGGGGGGRGRDRSRSRSRSRSPRRDNRDRSKSRSRSRSPDDKRDDKDDKRDDKDDKRDDKDDKRDDDKDDKDDKRDDDKDDKRDD